MTEQDRIDLARAPSFRLGPLTVEPPLRQVTARSSETLEPRVMQVLVALAMADGAIVSRDDLVAQCWEGRIVGDDSINRVISRLRRLAEEHGAGSFRIETITKVGYRLVGTVAPLEAALAKRANPLEATPPAPAVRRRWPLALAALIAVALVGAFFWYQATRPVGPARIALTGFKAIGPGIPASTPTAIEEATLAAFSQDGEVTIARARPEGDSSYTLGGTIERRGDTLAISMRIENRSTGAALWSRVSEQPAAVLDKIPTWAAARLGTIARCGLGPLRIYGKPLSDASLGLLFSLCDTEQEGSVDRALDIARRLTEAEPNLAAGWSMRAFLARQVSFRPGNRTKAELDEIHQATDRAIALDPKDPMAWHVKVYEAPPEDLVAVDKAFQKALEARPSYCGCVYQDYANFLRGVGRTRDSRRMLGRAEDVAPLSPSPLAGLAQLNAAEGRIEEARDNIAQLTAIALDRRKSVSVALSNKVWLKDYAGAVALLQTDARDMQPAFRDAITAAFRALGQGDAGTRLAAAHALAATAVKCGCTNSFTIRLQAALGDTQGAFDVLDATKPGNFGPLLSSISWDPVFADVRRLPGFPRLTERAGLLAYWRTTKQRPDFCDDKAAPPVCRMI